MVMVSPPYRTVPLFGSYNAQTHVKSETQIILQILYSEHSETKIILKQLKSYRNSYYSLTSQCLIWHFFKEIFFVPKPARIDLVRGPTTYVAKCVWWGGIMRGNMNCLEKFVNIIVSHCSFEGCGFGLDAVTSECISCFDWNLKACS